MKNTAIYLTILITTLSVGFLAGLLVGRATMKSTVALPYSATTPTGETSNTEIADTDTAIKININTANKADLMLLPGIGEKLAQAIIDYRNDHGSFQEPSDLLDVPGIGNGRLDAISEYITVGG